MKQWIEKGRTRGGVLLAACVIGLAACSSPTDKANKYYERGMALLKQGDLVKARLELQNALQIKQDMVGAWYALALIAEQQAEWQRLFGLLNKVIDHDPKHLDAHIRLGRLMLAAGQLDKALAASDTTMALAADNADVLALRASVLYKLDDRKGAVELANAALAKSPENVDALVVLATERLGAKDGAKAIEYLDRGLKQNEKNVALQLIKVQAFESLAQMDKAEEVFRKLIKLYPEVRQLRHVVAQFYLSHGRVDAAEAEYRAVVAENPKDAAAKLDLVRFVGSVKGAAAARQALDAMIAQDPANIELKFALAAMQQAQGDRKGAEAAFRAIAEKVGDSPEGLRAKGQLAAEALARGDKSATEKMVSEILTKDQRNEQALLLKAGMAIDEHQLDQAIADLRTILRDTPNSARALLMLGKAHELAGSPELAQENYLKAHQAAKGVPTVGMAYAEFLLKRGQAARAGDVAEEVLRGTPGYVPAMRLLAQARINQGDWIRAQAVADELGRVQNQKQAADQVRGAIFAARKNYSESIAAFRRAFDESPNDVQPLVSLVRSYLLAGKQDEAIAFLRSVVRASPGNTDAKLLLAQLLGMKGDLAGSRQAFQSAVAERPKDAAAHIGLANVYMRENRTSDAEAAVAQGLAALPGDFSLRLTQAGIYEVTGRIDEAIKAYEVLLKERPGADVVANNLASLLSDHRTDKASLTRAAELAQRFKRSDVPQFKDTLGWANYRLGKAADAIGPIEDAAKQLPDVPVFRYHLGMSYLAMNNKEAARRELEKALALAGGKPFPEEQQVRQALKGL